MVFIGKDLVLRLPRSICLSIADRCPLVLMLQVSKMVFIGKDLDLDLDRQLLISNRFNHQPASFRSFVPHLRCPRWCSSARNWTAS